MIIVKTIDSHGGACPYQIEGITDDGKYFYLRYRAGRLRAGVSDNCEVFWDSPLPYNVIDINHGEELDGWARHDEFSKLLNNVVKFPDGFRIESYTEEQINNWPKHGEQ